MTDRRSLPRRGFLGTVAAAAAGTGVSWSELHASSPGRPAAEPWLDALTGEHRCLFDFPTHGTGLPLIHMFNYLNTYKSAYNITAPRVNAVGTFYFIGPTSSLPLAFNDAMWAKYKFGEALQLTDPGTGKPSVRNMFEAPRAGDPVLFGGQMAMASMANLRQMGASFLLCNNALGVWVGQMAQQGMGTAAAIDAELKANLLPGVHVVPAMVIAIEMAQKAGVAYNKQG